jgi:predicted nucleic acid-binding protein
MIDTDVFIRIFRGDGALKVKVDALATDAAVNTIVYLELLQGAQNAQQSRDTQAYLARFTLLPLTPAVSNKAIELVRLHARAHGLRLADSLIAATCIEENLSLLTFNFKHFRSIQDLNLTLI